MAQTVFLCHKQLSILCSKIDKSQVIKGDIKEDFPLSPR